MNDYKFKCKNYISKSCTSCDLLHLDDYQRSVDHKSKIITDLFIGHHINPTVTCEYIEGSRNKAKFAIGGTVDSPIIGIRNKNGEISEVTDCPLHLPEINTLAKYLKKKITNYNLTPYSIDSRKGELKYILIFQSEQTKKIMLRFILRSKEALDRIRILYETELINDFYDLALVSANIQPKHAAILEGEEEIILSKEKFIEANLDDKKVFLAPQSFFQVTSHIATKLYKNASQYINKYECNSILDLFCGVGLFAIFCTDQTRKVTGVEISKNAIECAKLATKMNHMNIDFIAKDATKFITQNNRQFDCIITNPPRRGLNSDIISKIIELNPKIFIYSSCNPETLKRDQTALEKKFKLINLTPYDMFPLTNHLECLAVFERL